VFLEFRAFRLPEELLFPLFRSSMTPPPPVCAQSYVAFVTIMCLHNKWLPWSQMLLCSPRRKRTFGRLQELFCAEVLPQRRCSAPSLAPGAAARLTPLSTGLHCCPCHSPQKKDKALLGFQELPPPPPHTPPTRFREGVLGTPIRQSVALPQFQDSIRQFNAF
jgi:hypothetical protein